MISRFYLFLLLFPLHVICQVKPNSWQDHISINSANSVTKNGSTIYASNRVGLFMIDEKEMSPEPLNKINGLSDVGIRLVRTNQFNNKLLVIYDNSNIDVINKANRITNYPDFKLKSLSGKKLVNEVSFDKQLAYLACGFGIVVFDTDKMEVRDTYIIGPNGTELEVFQVEVNDSLIFAATENGLWYSNYKTNDLRNYQNWKQINTGLPVGPYASIVKAANTLLTVYTPSKLSDTIKNKDQVYYLDNNNQWQVFQPLAGVRNYIKLGHTYQDWFSFIDATTFGVMHVPTGTLTNNISSVNGEVQYGQIRDAYFSKDYTGNLSYWVADNFFGLYQTLGYHPYDKQIRIPRNGTISTKIGSMDVFNGKLALAPSLIVNAGTGNYLREGVNLYNNNEWTYLPISSANNQTLLDVTSVLIDRKDDSKLWVATWGHGVLQYKNNKLVKEYTPSSDGLPVYADNLPRCGGLSTDKDGNIWFAHSDQKGFLGVIKSATGQYQNIQFEGGRFTRKTYVDKNGLVWMLHERDGGITVYKPSIKNGIYATPIEDQNYRVLKSSPGQGNLESISVYSIAEDKDGRVWIGTTAGIRVFYNPNSIFTNGDYDAQPIKIVQDGNVELLLGKETVTSIVVDGANNKWCGTLLGGVYCFSPDGQRQLFHFTKDNSPLYSDNIIDINYDEKTGDIFIGSEAGLQSFRSTIIEGAEIYTDMHAYPNPVKPGYQGKVLVRGLMDNSIVKISDESGNLVWETKSTGGQIEWPVTNLSGSRVTSGVYIVYGSTSNGEFRALTKVLVVN